MDQIMLEEKVPGIASFANMMVARNKLELGAHVLHIYGCAIHVTIEQLIGAWTKLLLVLIGRYLLSISCHFRTSRILLIWVTLIYLLIQPQIKIVTHFSLKV